MGVLRKVCNGHLPIEMRSGYRLVKAVFKDDRKACALAAVNMVQPLQSLLFSLLLAEDLPHVSKSKSVGRFMGSSLCMCGSHSSALPACGAILGSVGDNSRALLASHQSIL